MIIFEVSYSGMVSDQDQEHVPVAYQRELRKEKFVSPSHLGRGLVFARGVLFHV